MIIVYILLGISLLLNVWCVWGILSNTQTLKIIIEHMDFKDRNEPKYESPYKTKLSDLLR